MPRIDERLEQGYLEVRPTRSSVGVMPAEVAMAGIRWAYARGYCDSLAAGSWEERARTVAEAVLLLPLPKQS